MYQTSPGLGGKGQSRGWTGHLGRGAAGHQPVRRVCGRLTMSAPWIHHIRRGAVGKGWKRNLCKNRINFAELKSKLYITYPDEL